jgi:tetratricopeptide (TPR) repeat protein
MACYVHYHHFIISFAGSNGQQRALLRCIYHYIKRNHAFTCSPTEAPEAWYHLGRIYAFPGRWEEAAEAYRHAYNLHPMNDLIRRMYQAARRK